MNRKPDVIRSLVIIFVVGLVISGFTHMGASEKSASAQLPQTLLQDGSAKSIWRSENAQ